MKIKTKIIILSILLVSFLAIAFLVANKNSFIVNLDNSVKTFMLNHESPSITETMLSITKIGNVTEAIIIFIIFGLFLIIKNKKYFFTFTIATSLGAILPEAIKYIVQRFRPDSLLLTEAGFSFPSVHATVAIIFLLSSLFLMVPLMKKGFSKNIFLLITAVIFPLVAFSRIYLSVHYTSDVVAGIILGSICFIFSEITCCQEKENML